MGLDTPSQNQARQSGCCCFIAILSWHAVCHLAGQLLIVVVVVSSYTMCSAWPRHHSILNGYRPASFVHRAHLSAPTRIPTLPANGHPPARLAPTRSAHWTFAASRHGCESFWRSPADLLLHHHNARRLRGPAACLRATAILPIAGRQTHPAGYAPWIVLCCAFRVVARRVVNPT